MLYTVYQFSSLATVSELLAYKFCSGCNSWVSQGVYLHLQSCTGYFFTVSNTTMNYIIGTPDSTDLRKLFTGVREFRHLNGSHI